jgi:tryptophan halogenase
LESTSIHLVQAGIARLIAMFPDRRFNPLERDEYNRQMQAQFEWVRDFVILHYKAMQERDDSDFWRQCAAMEVPDTLTEKIEQFRNKARFFADGFELFPRQSWVSVMLGQNIMPDDYEPVVDGLDEEKVSQALEHLRAVIQETADRMPLHGDFVRQCCTPVNPAAARTEFAF